MFVLLPVALITGPFLPDLFVVIISIAGILFFIIKQKWSEFNNLHTQFFISIYSIILVSGLFSDNIFKSLIDFDGPIFYFRYLFFIIFAQYILNTQKKLLDNFIITLNVVIFFVSVHGFLQWSIGIGIFEPNLKTTRITGIFGKEEILGHFLGFMAPLLYILNLYKFKNNFFWINSFFFLFCVFVAFISGDRTGFLKILLFFISIIFFINIYKKYYIHILIAFFTLVFFSISFSDNLFNRVNQTIKDVTSLNVPFMPYSKTHEYHFISAFRMFKDRPLLGYGPQGFRIYCTQNEEFNFIKNSCNNHPHNYYFQSLSELGFFGFILLIVLFLSLSYKIFKKIYQNSILKVKYTNYPLKTLLMIQFFLNIFPIMAHFNFYNNWANILIYLNIIFLIYFHNQHEE